MVVMMAVEGDGGQSSYGVPPQCLRNPPARYCTRVGWWGLNIATLSTVHHISSFERLLFTGTSLRNESWWEGRAGNQSVR